jgi:hypothetical protein
MSFSKTPRKNIIFRSVAFVILCAFNISLVTVPSLSFAASESLLDLPAPGTMVDLTSSYVPVIAKGLRVHPENPILFDLIVDTGSSGFNSSASELRDESQKLIKYFLASLTIPEDDLWVNLSPYEKNRIIPEQLGQTVMGRDMLAQDYVLKQLTASLIYPEKDLGKEFWNKVYAKSQQLYGSTEVPVNTFNKVWIVAEKAKIYVHDNTAFVVGSHLKVMLEEDYLSKNRHGQTGAATSTNTIGSQVVREVVIPELENEVNTGRNFANLRQIFNSMILAAWYKKNLKESILNQVYSNKAMINGVDVEDKTIKEQIYQEYLRAYKKGVFNYIKEDDFNGQPMARKYFSGGEELMRVFKPEGIQEVTGDDSAVRNFKSDGAMVSVHFTTPGLNDEAMASKKVNLLGNTPGLGIFPQQLVIEIKKEMAQPGTGHIPSIATISDQHGTIDKFDALLLDIFKSAPAGKNISLDKLDPNKSLAEQGIHLQDFVGELFVHDLGDFMDRGPFGVKVFYRSKELIDAGLSDFVIGNHDQWMFMNLIGLHLPYYDNFEFYGYKDSYDSKRGGGDVRFLLTQKHAEDPETRKPMWWAHKLAEFRRFHEDQQKTRWKSFDALINGPDGLFARVINGKSEDEKKEWYRTDAGRIWNKLRGFDPNVGDVATGVKAVGLVSIVWWEQLLKEFESTYTNLYLIHQIEKDTAAQEAWKSAINIIKNHILPSLKETLEEHIDPSKGEPQWWWRIFEAINSQNYTSPEWWAQDWAYHKGWGPTVFDEINNTYHQGERVVTVDNYFDEDSNIKGVGVLKEIAKFFKDHYTLHIRDIMQTDLMHAFLPIDRNTGEFYFNYKGQQYQGKGGNGALPYWIGLQRIAEDIRNAPNDWTLIKSIYEAKTIVNAWYADNTTEAKALNVAKAFRDIGVKKVAEANGINRLITGHIPMHDYLKLKEDERRIITGHLISTEDGKYTFADSDGGMGEKFGGGGKYLIQDADGFRLRGFSGKKSVSIEDNPPTIIFKKDATGEETPKTIYKNDNPIPAPVFLSNVLSNLEESLHGNDAAMSVQQQRKFLSGFISKDAIDLLSRIQSRLSSEQTLSNSISGQNINKLRDLNEQAPSSATIKYVVVPLNNQKNAVELLGKIKGNAGVQYRFLGISQGLLNKNLAYNSQLVSQYVESMRQRAVVVSELNSVRGRPAPFENKELYYRLPELNGLYSGLESLVKDFNELGLQIRQKPVSIQLSEGNMYVRIGTPDQSRSYDANIFNDAGNMFWNWAAQFSDAAMTTATDRVNLNLRPNEVSKEIPLFNGQKLLNIGGRLITFSRRSINSLEFQRQGGSTRNIEKLGDSQEYRLTNEINKTYVFKIKVTLTTRGFTITNIDSNQSVEIKDSAQLKTVESQSRQFVRQREEPVDNASMATRGGIDFNSKNLQLDTEGQQINMTLDPAMIEQFKTGNFSGIYPIILNITPIPSIVPLLGLKEESTQIARI